MSLGIQSKSREEARSRMERTSHISRRERGKEGEGQWAVLSLSLSFGWDKQEFDDGTYSWRFNETSVTCTDVPSAKIVDRLRPGGSAGGWVGGFPAWLLDFSCTPGKDLLWRKDEHSSSLRMWVMAGLGGLSQKPPALSITCGLVERPWVSGCKGGTLSSWDGPASSNVFLRHPYVTSDVNTLRKATMLKCTKWYHVEECWLRIPLTEEFICIILLAALSLLKVILTLVQMQF